MRLNKFILAFLILTLFTACSKYVKRKFKTKPYTVNFVYEEYRLFYDIIARLNSKGKFNVKEVKKSILHFIKGFDFHKNIDDLKDYAFFYAIMNEDLRGTEAYSQEIIEYFINSIVKNKIFKNLNVLRIYNSYFENYICSYEYASYQDFIGRTRRKFLSKKIVKNPRYLITITNFGSIAVYGTKNSAPAKMIYLMGYQVKDLKSNQYLLKQLKLIKFKDYIYFSAHNHEYMYDNYTLRVPKKMTVDFLIQLAKTMRDMK